MREMNKKMLELLETKMIAIMTKITQNQEHIFKLLKSRLPAADGATAAAAEDEDDSFTFHPASSSQSSMAESFDSAFIQNFKEKTSMGQPLGPTAAAIAANAPAADAATAADAAAAEPMVMID